MTWAAVGMIGAAAIGYMGSQDAAQSAQNQQNQNIGLQQQWNQQQDPFSAGGNRQQYVGQLNALMQGGYQGIQDDPMFKWQQQRGMENVQRGMASQGQGASGQEMLALQKEGSGQAMSFFDQQYQRLASLSGASRGGGQAAQGQSPGAAYQQTMGGYQNIAAGLGGLASLGGSTQGSIFGNPNAERNYGSSGVPEQTFLQGQY